MSEPKPKSTRPEDKPASKGLIFEEVSDGFRTMTRASLNYEYATLEDHVAFWRWLAAQPVPPTETIYEELARRANEIEARLNGVDASAHPAIPAHIAAIRSKVSTARHISTALTTFKPPQVREQLEAVEPLFFKIEVLTKLVKPAKHGQKFTGRKEGSIGPVRKFLRSYMAKNPKAKAAQAWAAIKMKPPKGVAVDDAFVLKDRRITTEGAKPTSYLQFQNIVSEERPKKD
jgi:hypothetical protein